MTAIYAAATFLAPISPSVLVAVVYSGPLERELSTGLSLGIVRLGVVVKILLVLRSMGITIGSFADSLPDN